MASEQLFRRENKTNERDVHVEKDRVPKMTTHFEHLSVTEQKLPQGSIDALQGGEINKDHAGKAIGDIGGIGKSRETHELGSNFQSLSDCNKNESYRDHAYVPVNANLAGNRAENRVGGKASGDIGGIGKAREAHELGSNFQSLPDRNENQSYLDRARGPGNANLAGNRAENRVGEKESGKAIGDIGGIGKSREAHELGSNFQSLPDRNENQSYLDRARVPVNANVAGNRAENRVGAKEDFGAVRDVGKFQMESIGGNKGLADDREKLDARTRVVTGTPQMKETNRGMGTGQVMAEKGTKTGGRVLGVPENQGAMWGKNAEREIEEEKGRMKLGETRGRKIGAEDEVAMLGKNAAEQREKAREEEEEKRSTLEEITKYRNQAQQSAMEAISAAQERAAQAKDVTKDTVSNAAKTATDYAYPAAEKAKSAAVQAKDVTLETGMTAAEKAKCAAAQAKETGMTAAEKAKNAALQAKDVTVETGMTAAEKAKAAAGVAGKVAVDLKDKATDKATVAGWTAAHYSTKLAVDGTKAAANAVEGAAGYVVPKAAELASKSVDVVKGLASSTGETAKEFTSKKKDQSWREYEAKRVSGQLQ
ncbi:putative seed biotin containing protein SBP65, partial [Trifolium pratense]